MSEANAPGNAEQPIDEPTLTPEADCADAAIEQLGAEDLQSLLKQADDRALRAQAELENFRKRARRDMDEQRRYANLPLVADLLPAIDNLDRAVEAAEKDENATSLLAGVKMVAEHIRSILAQHSCMQIEAERRPFDPNVHEAIAQEPSDDIPAGSVTRVVRVGYQLHERVIRPTQVMVSTGPA
ncbi:MAG: nucleotide exchange factor GrpE [Planctomycetaceae bacterium]|jgi:molecular chaperone GrpE|nr:nucleotide exchange factor GrpE [Planctomycetaceae bacterium]